MVSSPLHLPSPNDLQASIHHELYFNNPARWVNDRLGEFVWSKQREMLESLRDNRRTSVHSCHRIGKALRHGTPVLTIDGWAPIESINIGDMVFDRNGKQTKVVGVWPQGVRELYRIRFTDGTEIDTDKQHLWTAWQRSRNNKAKPDEQTITSQDLFEWYSDPRLCQPWYRWRTPQPPTLDIPSQLVSLDAYTLGVILGDGCLRGNQPTITKTEDLDILSMMSCEVSPHADGRSYGLLRLKPVLISLGLMGLKSEDKFIPDEYLWNDIETRKSILAGLLDTDGGVAGAGIEWSSASSQLADNVEWLVRSLGGTVTRKLRSTRYKKDNKHIEAQDSHRLYIRLTENPFRCERKRLQYKPLWHVIDRIIESVTSIDSDFATCITVDSPTSCFVTKNHVVTHNSFLGGRIAFWWLDTHPPGEALVITSAHSSAQVKMALWREMGRVHAKGKFPGRMNQVEYWMPMPSGVEEMVAFGRKPADNDPGAFQGTYSKYVLFILDEACYVPETLWDGAETLIGNEFSRIIAFGNPDDPNTEFARVCKPGSGWNVIKIGYMDTPNFTNEQVPQSVKDMLIGPTWVEEKRRKWGEKNPLFISKVLGEFPETSTDGLIPMQWIRAAQERDLSHETEPSELGVDVGGGGDKNTIAHRRGGYVRIVGGDQNPDTMQTLSNVLDKLKETGATKAKVDQIGIGWGAVNRAAEMAVDQDVIKETPDLARRAGLVEGVMVSQSAEDKEQFINLRAEGCWALRERFREGTIDIDINDDDLASQLANIRYKRSAGRIQIESKEEMKRRGMHSPDEFESVMLAFLKVPYKVEEEIVYTVSWG